MLITAINEGDDPQTEATDLQISTLADTWIHLSYLVRSGERNRALTIIKSRGTWHSNQVRELILSNAGPMLADVYTAGGEVLMGTLRWEKEDEERGQRRCSGAPSSITSARELEISRSRHPCAHQGPAAGSRAAARRSWRCFPTTTRRASFPRASARRSCAGSAAQTRHAPMPLAAKRNGSNGETGRRAHDAALRRAKTQALAPAAVTTVVVMRLYIANSAPNSARAIANLAAICKEHLRGRIQARDHRCSRVSAARPGRRHPGHAEPHQALALAGGEDRRQPQRSKQRASRARNQGMSASPRGPGGGGVSAW